MKCKKCKRDLAIDNAIFCNWCGARLVKDNSVERIPAPVQLKSGSWRVQIMVNGARVSNTLKTKAEAEQWARSAKAKAEELSNNPASITLADAIDKYIASKSNILSPSTLLSYKRIKKSRFAELQKKRVCDITPELAQNAVNAEAAKVAPKTVCNAWGLVYIASKTICGKTLTATLPKKPKTEKEFIQPDKLPAFIAQIKGLRSEAVILLGLHSLRISEALSIGRGDVRDGYIYVRGALVESESGYVLRDINKTAESTRIVPVLIPRLNELAGELPLKLTRKQVYTDMQDACNAVGIPFVGFHGLRHSFASLCHYCGISELQCQAWGGWKTNNILRSVYTHISEAETESAVKTLSDFLTDKPAVN